MTDVTSSVAKVVAYASTSLTADLLHDRRGLDASGQLLSATVPRNGSTLTLLFGRHRDVQLDTAINDAPCPHLLPLGDKARTYDFRAIRLNGGPGVAHELPAEPPLGGFAIDQKLGGRDHFELQRGGDLFGV